MGWQGIRAFPHALHVRPVSLFLIHRKLMFQALHSINSTNHLPYFQYVFTFPIPPVLTISPTTIQQTHCSSRGRSSISGQHAVRKAWIPIEASLRY